MPRPSHVRDAVRSRLDGHSRHGWSIDELKDDLRDAGVPADYSSVFRALVWLEARGEAQRFDLGDGKARYEAPGEHHEHLQCGACGGIQEVSGCVVESAVESIERATGFEVQGHNLVLRGLCAGCRASGA